MNTLYQKIQKKLLKYSGATNLMKEAYGLDDHEDYDLIIVAPSWKPNKVFIDCDCQIQHVKEGPYYNGYLINTNDKKIGYIQTASGASNVLECCLILGHGKCGNILFIGSVGALINDIKLGDLIIPTYSISGDGASHYLNEMISTENFHKNNYPNEELTKSLVNIASNNKIKIDRKVIYSTDSVYCEYMHLEQILKLGAEAIEMETAVFFRSMNLIGKRGTALLCVSDNSATNNFLVGRSEEDTKKYRTSRGMYISKLILELIKIIEGE